MKTLNFIKCTTLLLLIHIAIISTGQTTQTFTTGSSTFTIPCGVTSITVQVWGGGGAGGGGSDTGAPGGSGGGGGGYCTQTISVTPGQVISYSVGAGGTGGTGNGGNGGTTTFGTVSASGGVGGAANGGAAGTGGNGCSGSGNNGVVTTTTTGGSGGSTVSGGIGGAGGSVGVNGSPGGIPGGGGGGGGQRVGGSESGGDGGRGQITIMYSVDTFNQYAGVSCSTAGTVSSGSSYGGDFCEADGTGTYTSTNACGVVASDELWYSITLPAGCSTLDVEITDNTTGGNLSVELLTSTSNLCNPLTLEGSGCGLSPVAVGNFPPSTYLGKIVWIRVTGDNITEPSGTFTITPTITSGLPAPNEDDCSDPVVLGSGGSVAGDNFCATASTTTDPAPASLCAISIENTVWYQYCPTASGTFSITFSNIACAGGGAGIQAGIFTNSGGSSPICTSGAWTALTETDNSAACGSTSSTSLTIGPVNMTAGTCYYIGVDGNAGAFCSYDINLTTVLPITIESITGKTVENKNVINWTTVSEINNQYQIVESSENGSTNWIEVGRVKGNLGLADRRTYEIVDDEPHLLTYYRIHSIDFDGKEEFSSIIYIRNNSKSIEEKFSIIPNPSIDNINVLFHADTDSQAKINIYDINGKQQFVEHFTTVKGDQIRNIDLSTFDLGVFVLRLEVNGKTLVNKFVRL